MRSGETAGDGRTSEMHHRIDTLERAGVGSLRLPGSLRRATGLTPHQANDTVPAGGEIRAEGGTDQARRARDCHRQAASVRPCVRSQVVGELLVPVAESLQEERARDRRVDAVDDPGCAVTDLLEGVRVPPMQRQRDELVHEPVRGVVIRVLRDPTHPSGQLQHRSTVDQRRRLLCDLERLPGWEQPRQSTRALMPRKDLVQRSVDDARVPQTHVLLPSGHATTTATLPCRVLHTMGEPSKGIRTVDTLLIDQPHEGVTRITLDRPERLNAMNAALIAELHEALAGVAADRSCRVVVVTGAGRGFCAGLDLVGYGAAPVSEGLDRVGATFATQTDIAALVPRLRAMPQPVIAAVNGPAAGGGLALALASDIRLASTSARFNVAFVRLGLSGCDIGVSWLLPRLIGASRAWELMLTGRIIDAEEADSRRAGAPGGGRRRVAERGTGHRRSDRGERPMGGPDDQRGHVVPARGRLSPGGHRPREPDPGPLVNDQRHARSGGCLPAEATPRLRELRGAAVLTMQASLPSAQWWAWLRCHSMRRASDPTRRRARSSPWWTGAGLALTLLIAGCAAVGTSDGQSAAQSGVMAPARSVNPSPDYLANCAPVGADTSGPCLRLTLDAIDSARADEGLAASWRSRRTSVA